MPGPRCFGFDGEGSEELLAALARSWQLEASVSSRGSSERRELRLSLPSRSGRQEVDFDWCDAIPDAAWELLGDGAWPGLRVAKGVPEEHQQRLREASLDLEVSAGGWSVRIQASVCRSPERRTLPIHAGEAASSTGSDSSAGSQLPMYPAFITSVVMPGEGGTAAVQGDLDLLPALAGSDVEELNLDLCRDVPAAVWQQLGQAQGEVFQKLRKATFKSCFAGGSKGADGAAGLLLALSRCQLLQDMRKVLELPTPHASPNSAAEQSTGDPALGQELGMADCGKVPAAAWQLLATARWEQLRKEASLLSEDAVPRCFGRASEGAAGVGGLLSALARCRQLQASEGAEAVLRRAKLMVVDATFLVSGNLASVQSPQTPEKIQPFLGLEELLMGRCSQVPAAAWQQLEGAHWPKLTTVNFDGCFDEDSKGADGAAGLLAALACCPELQELRMGCCSQIPAAAWQQLECAHWPKLTKELRMGCCSQIPAAAWQQLEGAHWPKLTKANFTRCLECLSALAGLGLCQVLTLGQCDQIPAAAWQQLEGAVWSKLTRANFDKCFGETSKGADGVAGLLMALARCPELEDASSLSLQRSMPTEAS
ncbi:unnamed protein product [Symbiodinium necroappetens]|uniref:Uncharacterized protein n=1 Tax=Symbiodinium necroappetens TaxID=1628268 RepID=A0A812UCH5_9DINO|nr:unnamed protein product [Symbiodinium necroappetens]